MQTMVLPKKQNNHDTYNSYTRSNNNTAHGPTFHSGDSSMHQYDSCNHPCTVNKSLTIRVTHHDKIRRQRYYQHEEDCLKDDEYSLDASNNSLRGEIFVDHNNKSCINGLMQ